MPEENNTPTPEDVLGAFFDGGTNDDTPPTPEDTPSLPDNSNPPEQPPVQTPEETPTDTPQSTPPTSEDFNSPFDTDTPPSPEPETGFNEEAFDAETDQKLKEMETDKHPGIKYKELRGELKELKKALKEAGSAQVVPEDYESLKAQVASYKEMETQFQELKQEAALTNYKHTPEYENEVMKPFAAIQESAALIEQAAGLEKGSIIKAIGNSDRNKQDVAIEALSENSSVTKRDISTINRLADEMNILYGKENYIAKNAEQRMAEYQERQTSEQAVQAEKSQQQFAQEVSGIFSQFENKIPTLIEDGQKSEKYSSMLSKAQAINFSNLSDDQAAFAAMASVLLPTVVSQLKETKQKVKDLEGLNDQYRGASPKSGSGIPPQGQTKEVDPDSVLAGFINGTS